MYKYLFLLLFCGLVLPLRSQNTSLAYIDNADNGNVQVIQPSSAISLLSDSVVNFARQFLGKPYRSSSHNGYVFDCSGFTSFVFQNYGIQLKRSSAEQASQYPEINRNELRPGDLVFFNGRQIGGRVGHVGIVTQANENGNFDFIHSASSSGISISNSESPYYARRFVKAGRVVLSNSEHAPSTILEQTNNPLVIPVANTPSPKTKELIHETPIHHHVKAQETLSSISRKYNVSINELQRLNHLDNVTILVGQRLLIREDSQKSSIRKSIENNQVAKKDNYYIIQKGETLYSISKKFNCSIDDLKSANNLIKNTLNIGQKLLINATQDQTQNSTAHPTQHTVSKGETLYSIAKAYNTTVNRLMEANQLQTYNIKSEMVLIIN
jgi:LysM repeat protein